MHESGKNLNIVKSELKARIIAEAMKAFTTKGIKGVTMDDIAADLGISKRTLYETFADKETILIECVKQQEKDKEIFSAKILAESDNVLEVILKFYEATIETYHKVDIRFFEDIKKYPKVNELLRQSSEKNHSEVIAFFMRGVDQGLFRDDVNFEIVNILVREQFYFLLKTEIFKTFSFIEVYESIVFTFLRGILTKKGQNILESFIRNHREYKNEDIKTDLSYEKDE